MASPTLPAFTMAFQPIVDADQRAVFAYVALVRGLEGEGATARGVLRGLRGAQIVNVVEKARAADDSMAETDLLGTEDAAAARELETDDDL